MELIHFTDESFSEEVLNLDSADRAKIGFGGIMKAATELKDKGNSNMGKGMRQSAMQWLVLPLSITLNFFLI